MELWGRTGRCTASGRRARRCRRPRPTASRSSPARPGPGHRADAVRTRPRASGDDERVTARLLAEHAALALDGALLAARQTQVASELQEGCCRPCSRGAPARAGRALPRGECGHGGRRRTSTTPSRRPGTGCSSSATSPARVRPRRPSPGWHATPSARRRATSATRPTRLRAERRDAPAARRPAALHRGARRMRLRRVGGAGGRTLRRSPAAARPARGRHRRARRPPGHPLGILDTPTFHDDSAVLESGDTLVLYTDGVTDAGGGDGGLGEEGLADVVAAGAGLPPVALLRAMEDAVSERGSVRDDIAMLAARVPLGQDPHLQHDDDDETSTSASAMNIAVRAVDRAETRVGRRTTGSCSSVSPLRRGRAGRTGSGPRGDPRCAGHDERRLELGDPRVGLRELVAQVVERAPGRRPARSRGARDRPRRPARPRRPRRARSACPRARRRAPRGRSDDAAEPAARVAQLAPQRVHRAREADLEAGVADPVGGRELQQRPAPGRERVGRRDVRRELERRRERGPQHPVPGAVGFDDRAQLEALDRVLQQQQLMRAPSVPGSAGRPSSSMMATSLPAGATWKRMTSKVGSTLRCRGVARPRHDRRPGGLRRRASPCARPRRRPRSSRRRDGDRRRGRADGRPGRRT